MDRQESRFARNLGVKEIIALAFGAAIGWGWVVLSGDWLKTGGTLGAILAFLIGGLIVVFVGMAYAELCPAMPQCGGEHVFSLRALGYNGSFVCSWALVLCYFGVVAFEACALPSVVEFVIPNFLQGYLYTVAEFDIYLTYVAVGVGSALLITYINYIGVEVASGVQKIFTFIILTVGVLLIVSAFVTGDVENTRPLFENGSSGVLSVAVMTPFFLVGFDVIPQAAEETTLPIKIIGKLMIFSILIAVFWYCLIIFAVSMLMDRASIMDADLCTAEALASAWGSYGGFASVVVVVGGIAGIMSSWNAFLVAGSRVLFAMSENNMLPRFFSKIHPKYKTPSNAILFLGSISCLAPLFGKVMMTWISNAASMATIVAYGFVVLSFLVLRKKEPDMERPYRVPAGKAVGTVGIVLVIGMFILYLPGMPSGLQISEWCIIGLWTLLGLCMYKYSRRRK